MDGTNTGLSYRRKEFNNHVQPKVTVDWFTEVVFQCKLQLMIYLASQIIWLFWLLNDS